MAKKKGIVLNFRDGNTYTDEEVLARIKEAIDNNNGSSSITINPPDGFKADNEMFSLMEKAIGAEGKFSGLSKYIDASAPIANRNPVEIKWDDYEADRKDYIGEYRSTMNQIALAANMAIAECDRLEHTKYTSLDSPILNSCNSSMARAVDHLIDLEMERADFVNEYKELIALDQTVE